MAKEEKKALVPKLRFPEFLETAAWDVLPMGGLLSLEYGASLPEHSRRPGIFPVMGSNGVVGYHDEALVKGPAIVIGRKGSVGEVNWIDTDCFPIDTTYYVENKQPSNVSMLFLYRLLQCAKLGQRGDPGAVPGLNRNAVHSLQAAIPQPSEQQKIADCLSSLDELIAAQGRKVEALKTYKRGLMQQLFPREGETLPRLRFPEFRDAPEWACVTLGSVTRFSSGGTPSKDKTSYWNGSIPWISASSMHDIRVSSSDLKVTPQAIGNGTRLAPKGSLLILVRGSMLFKRVPICIAVADVAFNQDVKALAVCDGVNAEFLLYQLLALSPKIQVNETGIGAGKIETETLAELPICLPSMVEQERIVDSLTFLEEQVTAESEKLNLLKAHKSGLMQQLFPSPEAVAV